MIRALKRKLRGSIIQSVPGGKVNILGGHSIGRTSRKGICICDLFRTVSEIELCHCTVPQLLIIKRLRTVSNTGIYCSSNKVGTVYLV
jgi:hypothetical protein